MSVIGPGGLPRSIFITGQNPFRLSASRSYPPDQFLSLIAVSSPYLESVLHAGLRWNTLTYTLIYPNCFKNCDMLRNTAAGFPFSYVLGSDANV
jgi:hypothetical protein